ncbi:5-oxoprolinase subunit B family protein [Nocardia mexicana]|uniref:KipI family sensor histidine kinase inhibitor n=1 Tax=Nocardia mexicana TaxID=279262 RepID=A0A370H5X0_9NOCA|nr:allophanate hydrolase subunit 1 [Nocardia mexicana]RDI50882.1 KipI family sensor histidine kinase inhibitor [Nocardia mexicana]
MSETSTLRDVRVLRILPAGDRALQLVPADADTLAGLVDELARRPIEGVRDFLPAAQTVLVTLDPRVRVDKVEARLREVAEAAATHRLEPAGATEAVRIPVRYDGADLAETAALLNISVPDLIERHTGAEWRCTFIGFAPGFGYLESPEAGLTVPRRAQSRTVVPAGSVALAGGYSAVYPRSTPGGWRIIGTTELRMWDLERPEPALLRPGARVRFVRAGEA